MLQAGQDDAAMAAERGREARAEVENQPSDKVHGGEVRLGTEPLITSPGRPEARDVMMSGWRGEAPGGAGAEDFSERKQRRF